MVTTDEYIEQIDWMCEKIKELREKIADMKLSLDINNRRVDEIWGKGFDHHLRLLKLEEAYEQDQEGS
jgi:hypothetical protein